MRKASGAGAADFALEAFLPYRLSVLAIRASRLFARRYAEAYGLSVSEWRVLAVLGRFGRLSATEVAERTAMDKVKVSRAVQALLRRGLLERQAEAADRRVLRLAMTRAGRQLHAGIVPEARTLEAALLAPFSAAERAALQALLDRLGERLVEMEAAERTARPRGAVTQP
jgi:DNA-binding MarR family transcriptional regulator